MKFEEKLMTLRKEKGWSQEDLSNQIGVSRQTISKWESSQTTPELNKLVELSKIFEISIDELVDNVKEENNEEKVYAKINLKPAYILMIIICLFFLIGIILSAVYINKTKKLYVENLMMITYEDNLTDKIEIMEIYSFNKNKECVGASFKIIVENQIDCENIIKQLSDKNNSVKNIVVNDRIITFSQNCHLNYSQSEIKEIKKNSLEHVQNLEIIDM